MSFQYNYSVGTLSFGTNGAAGFGILTDIAVSYDGNPQSFYGGDYRLPLAVELGDRSGEITCSGARFAVDDAILDNKYATVTLGHGQNGGGLSGTINNCKVTSYNVKSSQNAFITSDFNLAICSQDAAAATKAGDWPAWITPT